MMTQVDINRLIFVALTILGMCLLQRVINYKRQNRARQAVMPVIAIVYDILAIIYLMLHDSDIHKLNQFYQTLTGCDVAIANILLFGGYLILKIICLCVLKKIFRDTERMQKITDLFYVYDDETGNFFLRETQTDTRYIAKGFAWGSTGLTITLLAASWIGGTDKWTFNYFFPAAVTVVLWELWYYINGLTKEEYMTSIGGHSASYRKVSSFYRIREIYEKLFPGQILSAHTGCEYAASVGTTDMLREQELSEDRIDQIVARYFNTYGEREKFEADYVQAVNQMMHGKSTISFNPFYRDQGKYLVLPIISALLKGKKCIVVCGRRSITCDVPEWLREQLRAYTRLQSMWRVEQLDADTPDCEIGVLDFSHIYDVNVLEANRKFFEASGFILLLEPSLMVNTGQVGLSLIAEEAQSAGNQPVYCVCDRYTDGLVDTLSHLLKTEFTDVLAMPVPRCTYTGVSWNADGDYMRQRFFDKQTRFLGNGLELAAVAVKNQIPRVTWFGETKAPVRDIKWLAGQNFATICRYMNLPVQQKSLYEKIRFVPNLWCTEAEKQQFVLVEDEFCNMFSMMRAFLSRSEEQAFVNVLSENYLLRDYMRCNQHVFRANPYAVPSFVPDYVRSARNVMVKLLILMAIREVSEEEITDALELAGISVREPYQALCELLEKYTDSPAGLLQIRTAITNEDAAAMHKSNYFHIPEENFIRHFSDSLKTAYYIVEDEKREREYIDAKMFGHVTQTLLPGQFVTYDGKYYQAVRIHPSVGVVLQRASDHYDGRRYYRQIRKYMLSELREDEAVYDRNIMDFKVTVYPCDIHVETLGYLELKDAGDLRSAKEVFFGDEIGEYSCDRHYIRKNILRIRLKDTDIAEQFTMSVLLGELIRSLFPNAWHYLAVLTKEPEGLDGMLNYMLYDSEGEMEEHAIYIVEDSDMDLGLLEAVNRNLEKIFELMADFLDWHFDKMRESSFKDPVADEIVLPEELLNQKKQGMFSRMRRRMQRIFGKNDEEEKTTRSGGKEKDASETVEQETEVTADTETSEFTETVEMETAENSKEEADTNVEESEMSDVESIDEEQLGVVEENSEFEATETGESVSSDADAIVSESSDSNGSDTDVNDPVNSLIPEEEQIIVHEDGEDLFGIDGVPDDLDILMPIEPTRYQKECFLKFGFDDIDGRLKLKEVHEYLTMHGWGDNDLTKARKRMRFETGQLDLDAENTCDFCGIPLSGVSYDRLIDGRVRCNDCSMTAINQLGEFQELFRRSLNMLEDTYNIQIKVGIEVKTTDAKTIAKHAGMVFRPSTQFASRVLGFAQKKQGKYTLMIENGSPRLAAVDTVTHELTHIWQYLNWNDKQVLQVYQQNKKEWTALARDIVYEGMAMWSAIQMLYVMGETYYASQQEMLTEARTDVYGIGFRMYRRSYDLERNGEIPTVTPFQSFPPLEPEEIRELFQGME